MAQRGALDLRERIDFERERILVEHLRRDREVRADLYSPWDAAEGLLKSERKRIAVRLLREAGAFPNQSHHCLEVGSGSLGWLADLIGWHVPERNLHGIELSEKRVGEARNLLPNADLRVGDATALPWPDDMFQVVVASTMMATVLDPKVRKAVAAEIVRVLAPGGALIWYDLGVNNPRNPNVKRVGRGELRTLFAGLEGPIRRVTLAPPLARVLAPLSWPLATVLSGVPFLTTHLLAVLVKKAR